MYNLKGSLGLSARFCKENITILNARSGLIYHLGRIFCMLLVLVLVNLLCWLLLIFFFLRYYIFLFISIFLVFTLCVLFFCFFLALKVLIPVYQLFYFNLRTYKGGQGGGGGGWHPPKVFLSFLIDDKTSAPDVFSSCSFIPRAHFESSSVMVSFYGYGI